MSDSNINPLQSIAGSFQQPEEERDTLSAISDALAAFGAGVQGRLPEFREAQEGRRYRLSQQRQQAAAQDLMRARDLLDAGNIGGIVTLANERASLIDQMGGDPTDTMQLGQIAGLAAQGNAEALNFLRSELDQGLMAASRAGLIQLPQAPTPQSPEGKREADRRAGLLPAESPTARPSVLRGKAAEDLGFRKGTVVQKSGDGYRVLQSPDPAQRGESFTTLTAEEKAAANIPVETVVQRNNATGKLSILPVKFQSSAKKPITKIGQIRDAAANGEISDDEATRLIGQEMAVSGETAFKAGAIAEAVRVLPRLKQLLFDEDGQLNESNLLGFGPFRGPNRRQVDALSSMVVDAYLRGMSGAVIGESEVERGIETYMPSILDDDETALMKLNAFESLINSQANLLFGRDMSPEDAQTLEGATDTEILNMIRSGRQNGQ